MIMKGQETTGNPRSPNVPLYLLHVASDQFAGLELVTYVPGEGTDTRAKLEALLRRR